MRRRERGGRRISHDGWAVWSCSLEVGAGVGAGDGEAVVVVVGSKPKSWAERFGRRILRASLGPDIRKDMGTALPKERL